MLVKLLNTDFKKLKFTSKTSNNYLFSSPFIYFNSQNSFFYIIDTNLDGVKGDNYYNSAYL
jgi:hypothetical protein